MKTLCAALALLLGIGQAEAAVTANSAVTPQTPRLYIGRATSASTVALANGSGGNAGSNGTKIMSMVCANTDTTAHTVTVEIVRSSNADVIDTVQLAASSGNANGTPPVNMFSPINAPGLPTDNNLVPYLLLESGDAVNLIIGTAFSSGVVSCVAVGSDY